MSTVIYLIDLVNRDIIVNFNRDLIVINPIVLSIIVKPRQISRTSVTNRMIPIVYQSCCFEPQ